MEVKMPFEFKFPDVGEGIAEGLIVKWRVAEGENVTQDQALVEIETDKAIVEIPSPKAGKVIKHHFAENETVRVGEVLVTIDVGGKETVQEQTATPQRAPAVVGELSEDLGFSTTTKAPIERAATTIPPTMPRVRQIAQELGVDLASIHGTGPAGRVSEDDVRRAAQGKAAADAEKYGPVERIPFSGTRKSTAEHLLRTTSTVAMVTHFDMADVNALDRLRKKLTEEKGVKFSFIPFFIRATIRALKKFPNFNASLDEATSEIILKKYYHIGIAIDTEHGLIVPAIRDADKKSLVELATLTAGFAERARNRTIGLEELHGGTFTISNIGMIGGIFATPIMPYPQSSILVIGHIKDMPIVQDGDLSIGKQAPLSLSFDHRLIDGADAARFVNHITQDLSNPDGLL